MTITELHNKWYKDSSSLTPAEMEILRNDIQSGTKFVVNWGNDGFYFDDNMECLAYCWMLKEESGGLRSIGKAGMSREWYMITNGELKQFRPEVLSPQRLVLYQEWLSYFKPLRYNLSYKWFLCLYQSFYDTDTDTIYGLRDAALSLLNGQRTCAPSQSRPHAFFVDLREKWKTADRHKNWQA